MRFFCHIILTIIVWRRYDTKKLKKKIQYFLMKYIGIKIKKLTNN